MHKKECRQKMLNTLATMSEIEKNSEDCKIFENVVKLEIYKRAKTIFLYISVGHEADTRRIVVDAIAKNKRVAIPRCVGKGIMYAVLISSLDELVADKFNIPSAPMQNEVIPPNEIDMILVPGVAFDRTGSRLGRGGGYYDRYLAMIPDSVGTVGICHTVQLVEKVERDVHDRTVDVVVTPNEIILGER